jgi:hypothetical protein
VEGVAGDLLRAGDFEGPFEVDGLDGEAIAVRAEEEGVGVAEAGGLDGLLEGGFVDEGDVGAGDEAGLVGGLLADEVVEHRGSDGFPAAADVAAGGAPVADAPELAAGERARSHQYL